MDTLLARLAAITGPAHVLTDADLRASYETDWTRRFHGTARCVVRPGSTDEVAAVLRACRDAAVPVVPQGGNTGLVGGGVPRAGEVVLSTARLAGVEVDPVGREAICGAGVTLARLNDAALPHGLRLGVDLASRASATLGGMVSTNAGGINVLRYGMMRAQVAGLEAVLADGSVVDRLHGLRRDNSGFDLAGLLAGSEGTLAVITRVRLRLVPVLPAAAVVLLALPSVAEAIRIASAVQAQVTALNAAELFLEPGLELVVRHTGAARPFPGAHAAYLLLEATDRTDPSFALAEAVEAAAPGSLSAFATDARDRAALWAYRERHTEAVNAEGIPHKLDVALPLDRLDAFVAALPATLAAAAPAARPILFGHIAEGNLHVNLLGLGPDDEAADDAVLRLVASMSGSISAEHGIGIAKTRWLPLTRSAADIAAMRALKAALDPTNVLNPGVIFER